MYENSHLKCAFTNLNSIPHLRQEFRVVLLIIGTQYLTFYYN